MVEFVCGRTGTGKTGYIFSAAERAAVDGRRVIVLVPEREAVGTEKTAAELRGAANIDVVTFTRLCNYIFRREGGIAGLYIGKGAKKVIMHGVLSQYASELHAFGGISVSDTAITETLVSAASELRRNMITPADLDSASKKLNGKLGQKLSDLALIVTAFNSEVEKRWSDPDGMLNHAVELAESGGYFIGCDVFIDSFSAFTSQQAKMLSLIFTDADNVTVTLPYDCDADTDEPAFLTVTETDKKLVRLVSDAGRTVDKRTIMKDPVRFRSPALSYLSANLWHSSDRGTFGTTDDVRIIRAANVYAEAEAVAVDIMKKIHSGGMRYADIAVVVRSTDEYMGIIDAVMDKYGIPYFVSSRADITESPVCRLVMTALAMSDGGYSTDDLISFIKTDLCGIDADDCNRFENYITKWHIRAKSLGDEFVQNPRGYQDKFTDDDITALAGINKVRERICDLLGILTGVLKSCSDVRDYSAAVFDFLNKLGVPQRLRGLADEYRAAGNKEDAATVGILWHTFCDALDQLVTSAGDRKVCVAEYRALLRIVLSETDMGRIPTSADEVTIADPVLTNVAGVRSVYVMGCYDGGFPRRVSDDGIFTENEKKSLSDNAGIEISARLWKKLSDEMFFFLGAACSARESLTVTYPHYNLDGSELKPSVAVERLRKLFDGVDIADYEKTDKKDLLYSMNAAFELSFGNDILSDAIRNFCSSNSEYEYKFKYLDNSITSKECRLDGDSCDELLAGPLRLSYSSLENYVKCNFLYFCDRYLRISDDEPAEFSSLNAGSFLHRVLELGVRIVADNVDVDDDVLKAEISDIASRYIGQIYCGVPTKRLAHISELIQKFAFEYIDGFRAECRVSQFRPQDFELKIDKYGDAVTPMALSRGSVSIDLTGVIDRVDVYRDDDGKAYVRVIDYKTSERKFAIDDINKGINLQMLLYLFSICENGASRYGGEIVPAGAEYVSVNIQPENGTEKSTEKSGIFLADRRILDAMDSTPKKEHLPLKNSEIDNYDENAPINHLASKKAFDDLKENVKNTVFTNAERLKSGVANADPIKGAHSPCKYCRFSPICRVKKPKGR
ncbi:MAG: exodeoxyribonuclease V subunit gamma [Clostridia bacterium]|nr:exodeoxyribonuclease V subunit gamma [Clostridia bacterium]